MTDRLMKLSQWANREFADGSAPCTKTLKAWIDKGTIAGMKVGGQYYVRESFSLGEASNNTSEINSVVGELLKLSA